MAKYVSHSKGYPYGAYVWPVQAEPSGCYTIILKRIMEQMEAMLSYHHKILVIRFDLRQYTYTDDNKRITDYLGRLTGWIERYYKIKRATYVWAREMEKAKQQHYHFALMLDASTIKNSYTTMMMVKDHWERMSGSEWTPENHCYKVRRDSHQSQQEAFYRLSYLAKARGKGYKPRHAKDYNNSRLKPKP